MKRLRPLLLFVLLLTLSISGCSSIDVGSVIQGPTAVPGAGSSSVPTSEVLFMLQVPPTTPADAAISLEVVDVVTGVSYNGSLNPMESVGGGSWQVRLTVPVGSLLRYRYLRTAPSSAVEATTDGAAVRYRVAHVTGPMQFSDIVASWGDDPYQGGRGRILGQVTQRGSGDPVSEMIVTAAGRSTFTDAEGRFRLDGLPPGLHNVVVYDPDGQQRTTQQGAVVADGATTPAEFQVDSALPVTLTFEVTIPEGTPATDVRLAGNVKSLGTVFAGLPGGVEISAPRTPTLTQVDPTHYIYLGTFYAGTDLRYKFTLGDGLWNAERDANGRFVTRQWIVPETDSTVSVQVASWGDGSNPLVFNVQPPANTPAGDEISLQLQPFTWFEPLPMVPTGDGRWQFTLSGPLDFGDALHYRYCRNLACDIADDVDTRGADASGRSADLAVRQLPIEDTINAWAWWQEPAATLEPMTEPSEPRPDLDVGFELAPLYRPAWIRYDSAALDRVISAGANRVVFTPAWLATGTAHHPAFEFDPTRARFQGELIQQAANAKGRGLRVAFRPELAPADGTLQDWWRAGAKDYDWWSNFYDELRSFLLTEAQLAESAGADTFILTGAQLGPSVPGGTLPDASSASAPFDADSRWQSLISDLHTVFHGRLAYELEFGDDLAIPSAFLESFDEVHVYWHAPLTEEDEPDFDALRQQAGRLLDEEVIPAIPEGMPITISIEYLSVARSARACPPNPDGSCRPAAAFDGGAVVDNDLPVDLEAQSAAIEAVIAEASARPAVSGVTIRRYNPIAALQDKSASVFGKPAESVIQAWYQRLRGESGSQ